MSSKLDKAMTDINKRFGANTVMRMGDAAARLKVQVVPTQSLRLNRALGVGGIPRGRITEVYGLEGSGKSGIALGVCAEAQKAGGKVAWIDAECALDPHYAEVVGLDLNNIYYVQPSSGEEALDVAEALIRTGEIDVIVIDSVAALVPMAEMESEMEKQHMGLQGRMMSKACRKLTAIISKTKTACIFINQIREKIGGYGNPETTPGGRALKFYATTRIEVRKGDAIGDKEQPTGHILRASIKKNRVAPPHRKAEWPILYEIGVDTIDEIAEVAVEEGIIKRAGAWFSMVDANDKVKEGPDGPLKWQGIEKLKEYFRSNPKFYKEVYDAVMHKISAGQALVVCDEEIDPEEDDDELLELELSVEGEESLS